MMERESRGRGELQYAYVFVASRSKKYNMYVYEQLKLIFGKICGDMSWNGPKFWYVEKLSLHINFRHLGCNPSLELPLEGTENAPAFSRFFLKVSVKNYRHTLASNHGVS